MLPQILPLRARLTPTLTHPAVMCKPGDPKLGAGKARGRRKVWPCSDLARHGLCVQNLHKPLDCVSSFSIGVRRHLSHRWPARLHGTPTARTALSKMPDPEQKE